MVKIFSANSPVGLQHCAIAVVFFVFGYVTCLATHNRIFPQPAVSAGSKLGSHATEVVPAALVFRPKASVPINHPGERGQVSKVLKQVVLTGADASVPSLVHLSLVDFGDGS